MSGRSVSSTNLTSRAFVTSSREEGGAAATAVVTVPSAATTPLVLPPAVCDGYSVGVALGGSCRLKREEGTPSGKLPLGWRNRGPADAELGRVRRLVLPMLLLLTLLLWFRLMRLRPVDVNLGAVRLPPTSGSSGYNTACEETKDPPRFSSILLSLFPRAAAVAVPPPSFTYMHAAADARIHWTVNHTNSGGFPNTSDLTDDGPDT